MRKFFHSIFTFSLPLLIYVLIVQVVDPFNYHGSDNENKLARNIEPHLYKMISYRNAPKRNIILGDSRSNALFPIIQKKRMNSWSNLAYGGASLKEMIDTFWWLDENYPLDTIVMNVNFNHLNDYNKRDWITSTKSIIQHPISYSSSRYVFLYLYQKGLSVISDDQIDENKNNIAKETFWRNHLSSIKKKFYVDYKYSQSYLNDLNMIADRCKKRGIELIIWSAPVHKDIHEIIEDNGNGDLYLQSVLDLQSVGEYHNFNERLDWITNKDNFNDAMHVKHDIMDELYEIMFNQN